MLPAQLRIFFAALVTLLLQHATLYAQSIGLVNPNLSGFYPDPSVIRVGTDYYLVNSTFSYFPGLLVHHSKELKNWKQVEETFLFPS